MLLGKLNFFSVFYLLNTEHTFASSTCFLENKLYTRKYKNFFYKTLLKSVSRSFHFKGLYITDTTEGQISHKLYKTILYMIAN